MNPKIIGIGMVVVACLAIIIAAIVWVIKQAGWGKGLFIVGIITYISLAFYFLTK